MPSRMALERGWKGGGERSEIKFVEERTRGGEERTDRQTRPCHGTANRTPNPNPEQISSGGYIIQPLPSPFRRKRKAKTCIIFINRQTQQPVATHPTRRPNLSNHLFPVQGTNTGVTATTRMVLSPRVSTTRASASLPAISSGRTRYSQASSMPLRWAHPHIQI